MSGSPPIGPNRGSFRRGVSGNPGGKPQAAEVSALARRYTHDWLRGLVEVVRLPACRENAPSIVAAARELREVGYPGLTKGPPDAGAGSLHLHLLAVTREAQGVLDAVGAAGPVLEADVWGESGTGESAEEGESGTSFDPRYLPPLDRRPLPHEALPLWDAAAEPGGELGEAGEVGEP